MMVLGYTVLGHSPTILTLSLFVSIVSTLSRMYRDSEMVIWFSSGRGIGSFMRPLVRFVWPILLVIAALSLFAWPWAHRQSQTLRDQFEQRGDLERVAPGQFQESAGGSRVFFVDKDFVGGKTAGEVFIAATEKGKHTVTSARSGKIDVIGNDRFLMLSQGQQLETSVADGGLKLSEFEEYGVLVSDKVRETERAVSPRTLSTRTLLTARTPAYLGEFSWRLGLALAAANCVLIGLAVSRVNPRIGRNGNMILSFFTFILYYNLLTLGVSRIASGTSDIWPYMLVLHGGALILPSLLLIKLHWNWTLTATLRSRKTATAAAGAGASR